MANISSEMLHNTLHVLSLARQTAINQGKEQEADQIAPVENRLRHLVDQSAEVDQPEAAAPLLRNSDFQHLLEVKRKSGPSHPTGGEQDRNQIIQSMASAGMSEMEIARQMGMTSEEVEMIVKLSRRFGR
jgi:DNA-binding CsgD family transcriptional regulator